MIEQHDGIKNDTTTCTVQPGAKLRFECRSSDRFNFANIYRCSWCKFPNIQMSKKFIYMKHSQIFGFTATGFLKNLKN